MHTGNECLVCFMHQALRTVRHCTADPQLQWQVVTEIGGMLTGFDQTLSPPANAVHYYRHIARRTGIADPFIAIKRESNEYVLSLEARTRELIAQEADPLLAAMQFAINANVIDYGAQQQLDREAALSSCRQTLAINHYEELRRCIDRKARILYLADNCGEIVFDKILIEMLLKRGCPVVLAVREKPIINDATLEDVHFCGLDALCPVVTNDGDIPGTPYPVGDTEFGRLFNEADVILSKGMGNFESLSDVRAPLFFLFMVKCGPVRHYLSQHFPEAGLQVGSSVLLAGSRLCHD